MLCFPKLISSLPGANPRLPEHKNADFVLEMPENEGFEAPKAHKNLNFVLEKPENGGTKLKKSTKMAFLCLGLTFGLRLGLSLRLSWFLGLVCR